MGNEKDNKIRNLAKNLVRQTIKSVSRSGMIKNANGQIVEVNVHDKEKVKTAVELRIIRPFMNNSKAQYSLESKKQIQELIKIYDEIFEEEYDNYIKASGMPQVSVKDDGKSASSGKIGRLRSRYNMADKNEKRQEINMDMYYGVIESKHIREDLEK